MSGQASNVTLTPKHDRPTHDDTPTRSLTLTPLTPTPMPHDTTHEALFGYRASLPDVPVQDDGSDLAVDVASWRKLCDALRERAAIAGATAAYGERAHLVAALEAPTAYAVGDLALVHNPGQPHKWAAPVTGPWVITTGGGADPFRGPFFRAARIGVNGVAADTDEEFHLRRLRPYYACRDPTGVLAALRDTPPDEFVVGGIVSHKTDPRQPLPEDCSCKRPHLRWRVSWQGHGSAQDSWEPPSYLTKITLFKDYNGEHRLSAHASAQNKCERQHPLRAL